MKALAKGLLAVLMVVGAGGGAGVGPIARGAGAQGAGENGTISGRIEATARIVRLVAVDRAWADVLKVSTMSERGVLPDSVYEAKLEGEGGAQFKVEGLLPGRVYDLVAWTADGGKIVRWEGVTMDYCREVRRTGEATAEDRQALEGLVVDPKQFYDKVRVLRLAADHGHATALVELKRTRDFHSDKGGEVIYRVELWYFENLYGGWAKEKNTEKVLSRVRGKPGAFPKGWQFVPELGGMRAGTKGVEVKLPGEASAKRGLAGSVE